MYSQNCFGNTDWVFSSCLNVVCMYICGKAIRWPDRKKIALEELEEFSCLGFDQGQHNSFYFAEEVLSTYGYKRFIRANDRATLLNLMVGLNGYTLCSGIICEDLNGEDYCAVKLKSDERMTIGYISRKEAPVSAIGQKYLEEIAKYRDKLLD